MENAPTPLSAEQQKQAVGKAAAALVRPGMRVGLGTGSTARYLVDALGEAWKEGRLQGIVAVPTSRRTADQARGYGIPLADLSDVVTLDLTIDGADEVDPELDLIKGLGGALLREKIVACSSEMMVVMIDHTKLVERLGMKAPVPVEVEPFGFKSTVRALEGLGCRATLRMDGDVPYRTDGGHLCVDCRFERIDDPRGLDNAIRVIPGALETGLFVGIARLVLVGDPTGGVRTIEHPQ